MSSKWERVQPYYNLSIVQAEKMMSAINANKKISKIKLIREGLRNTNYYVEQDNKKFLLRIYEPDGDWWKKEKAVYEHMKDRVYVPELYYLCNKSEVINKPYAIFQYIDGLTLDKYIQQKNFNSGVVSKIGQKLSIVHKTPYKEVVFFSNTLEVDKKLPDLRLWYDMFLKENATKKLGEKLTKDVRTYIKANEVNIRRIEKDIALVHNDFRPINIIIDKNNTPYFIDWEFAMAGHILGDIGQFLRNRRQIGENEERLFIDSYNSLSKKKLPKDYKELAKLRDLINLLQMLNSKKSLENKDKSIIHMIKSTCSSW